MHFSDSALKNTDSSNIKLWMGKVKCVVCRRSHIFSQATLVNNPVKSCCHTLDCNWPRWANGVCKRQLLMLCCDSCPDTQSWRRILHAWFNLWSMYFQLLSEIRETPYLNGVYVFRPRGCFRVRDPLSQSKRIWKLKFVKQQLLFCC